MTPAPTDAELAAWDALAAKATPRVECDRYHEGRPRITTTAGDVILVADCETLDDAAFYAAAREGWPQCIAALRAARAELERARTGGWYGGMKASEPSAERAG